MILKMKDYGSLREHGERSIRFRCYNTMVVWLTSLKRGRLINIFSGILSK